MYGTVVGDIVALTPLLISVLVFILAILFRPQIEALVSRLTQFRLQHGETSVEVGAAPDQAPADQEDEAGTSAALENDQGLRELAQPDSSAQDLSDDRSSDHDALSSDDPPALRQGMLDAFSERNEEIAGRAFKRLQETEKDPRMRKLDEARYFTLGATYFSDATALQRLRELTSDAEIGGEAERFLSIHLHHTGNPTAAAAAAARAVEKAASPEDRSQALISQARALHAAGSTDAATDLIENSLGEQESHDSATLWQGLAEMYELNDDHESEAMALECVRQEEPSSARTNFRIAYTLSQTDEGPLIPVVLHHYEQAIRQDEDHVNAKNNAGVQYQAAKLPLTSVRRYEAASKGGNTLATANLAFLLIRAGFGRLARELLDEARTSQHVHGNVGSALSELTRAEDREDERQAALLTIGQRQADFLARHIQARLCGSLDRLEGPWRLGDGGVLSPHVSGGQLSAEWSEAARKRKVEGPVRREATDLQYFEMRYSTFGERRELGYERVGRAWWHLAESGDGLETMTAKDDGDPEFETLTRA